MSENAVEKVLAHYGVRGMRWGVRRPRNPKTGRVEEVVVKTKGGKITTSGGKGQPASEDAKFAAAALQKATASGISTLTTKELRAVTDRINAEQNFRTAMAKTQTKKKGRAFAKEVVRELAEVPVTETRKYLKSELSKSVATALVVAGTTSVNPKHKKKLP